MEQNYNIVKTAEGRMTTYKVEGMNSADTAAICAALTEAANDLWPHVKVAPGTYTSSKLAIGKDIKLETTKDFPQELEEIAIVCGDSHFGIGALENNLYRFFWTLAKYETLSGKKHMVLTKEDKDEKFGKLLSTARFTVPKDIRKIMTHADKVNGGRSQYILPHIDLKRHVLVATKGYTLVARHIHITEEREGKLEDIQWLPREVEKMAGQEIVVEFFKMGTRVTDANGAVYTIDFSDFDIAVPKWYMVVPQCTSCRLPIDAAALKKAITAVRAGGEDKNVLLQALALETEIMLEYNDYTKNIQNQVKVPVTWKSCGLRSLLSIELTVDCLNLNPTSIRYVGENRAVVWESADTIILEMPRMPEGNPPYVSWNGPMGDFPVDELFDDTAQQPSNPEPPKRTRKAKPAAPKVTKAAAPAPAAEAQKQTATISIADRLRAALRARLAA